MPGADPLQEAAVRAAQIRAVLDELDPDSRAVDRFAVHTATLDDVFLALTGHAATATGDRTGSRPTEQEPAGV